MFRLIHRKPQICGKESKVGDIGPNEREIEFLPLTEPAPEEEPTQAPVHERVPEKTPEKVPA